MKRRSVWKTSCASYSDHPVAIREAMNYFVGGSCCVSEASSVSSNRDRLGFDTHSAARYTDAPTTDGNSMRRTFYMLGGFLLAFALSGCGPRAESGNNALDERFDPLCRPCDTHDSCGTQQDYCLQNQGTGEAFCGVSCEVGECPEGYVCTEVGSTGISQCAPAEATCAGLRDPCDGACSVDQVCVQDACVDAGDWGGEQTFCVDYVNQLRASVDQPALQRSDDLDDCATAAAIEDARTGEPHGHFMRTNGCGYQALAETEVPGWSLEQYGTVEGVIEESAAVMFAEGPGGGHYEILTGDYAAMGCGIHVTEDDAVWVVHNFQ